ncbi:ABC transporter substrate-binding protein [Streptomyces sp. NPDC058467]|uniref:ABC transporter substrate-binding protein n=1 Tax=Streptomyces sp. NPDC058467 TaxID=3346513 RepID=UPI00364AE0C5
MRPLLPIAAASAASVVLLTACGAGSTSNAAASTATVSPACKQLQSAHPELAGKTFANAINPHTPGYEALDPNDPSRYVGFDIDLGSALGQCLGFKLTYKPVAFPALLPTLQSGQADLVISDIYATKDRAKAADFVTYSKVYDGVLVKKGNPKKLTGINTSLCGSTAALNTGFVEVPLVQDLAGACKAAGRPAPQVQLYDNNAQCIQAILAGRADTYINDVNTVTQAVKAHPNELGKATAVTLPYSIGIAVPKGKTQFRDAIKAALVEIQEDGTQTKLLKKWSLETSTLEAPRLVTG